MAETVEAGVATPKASLAISGNSWDRDNDALPDAATEAIRGSPTGAGATS